MPKNIKSIKLWDIHKGDVVCGKEHYNDIKQVRIEFNFPCSWTTLHIEDLKEIIREWIKGEEEVYPTEKGFKGRWLLFDEIKKVFEEK